jgi:hypothetical protein
MMPREPKDSPPELQPLLEYFSLEICIAAFIHKAIDRAKPFFCTNGSIGHTHGEIKEGDLICAFRESAFVIALRRIRDNHDFYEVSGIGWNPFRRIGLDPMGDLEIPGCGMLPDNTFGHPVHFLLSVQGPMLISPYRS